MLLVIKQKDYKKIRDPYNLKKKCQRIHSYGPCNGIARYRFKRWYTNTKDVTEYLCSMCHWRLPEDD